MLRALPLVVLVALSAPAAAAEPSRESAIAQQQTQPPQQAPKRDCEKRQEGVSS